MGSSKSGPKPIPLGYSVLGQNQSISTSTYGGGCRHPLGTAGLNTEGWPHWSGCFVVLVQKVGGEGSDPRLLRQGEPDHGFKAGGGHIHTPILLASQCPARFTQI